MTDGTWEPGTPSFATGAELAEAAALWDAHGVEAIPALPATLRASLQRTMQMPRDAIDPLIEALDDAQLEALIRLFTCIEAEPGFDAGARSPVIPLFRALRARIGADAATALVAWIREHSDNRFLPHGSLQDRLRA